METPKKCPSARSPRTISSQQSSSKMMPRAAEGTAAAALAAVGSLLIIRARLRRKRDLRSIAWLQGSLRLRDNEVIRRAALSGAAGMLVVLACEKGLARTASDVFFREAAHALDVQLRRAGNRLTVLHVASHKEAIEKVAALADEIHADAVFVDASEARGADDALDLELALASRECAARVVAICDDALMLPLYLSVKALGRSYAGGKILRWTSYLRQAAAFKPKLPFPAPKQLPPPAVIKEEAAALVRQVQWSSLLTHWGEVSEAKAMVLARRAGEMGHGSASSDTLGEDSGDQRHRHAEPSHLSPYLRWGVISPRDCIACGVRQRHLLWREWSRVAWRLCLPLRQGELVLPMLDRLCVREAKGNGTHTADQPMAEWSEERAFRAWCVGRTGALVVDAGMRQLWVMGWMPRGVRLLAAACLIEGLGVDWRRGRDWFAQTLVDHDFAINELMWQNAGMVGIDPYYRGLKWEALTPAYESYVSEWLHITLSLPTELKPFDALPVPSIGEVRRLAHDRRHMLSDVYQLAGRVARCGVRVNANGDVLRVGREPLSCLRTTKQSSATEEEYSEASVHSFNAK
ncbi:hypothetical protein AB1Y20_003418 [Prymnesium parvum]|uniref:Photolyase/cryptochrome alpha/beta domain-containing protein n=1 Tax=Prymnesium parvum TaxID=97485 RepID=A0AB34JE06_PRYPA